MKKMSVKKRVCILALAVVMTLSMVACSSKDKKDGKSKDSKEKYEVAVVIKATDSDFWQTTLKGAEAAMAKNPDKIHVTTYGPTSETDIDEQVSILENVITKHPDAIVIAPITSDAPVPALERAAEQGIKIVNLDNALNTDVYESFLRTDNVKGGSLAADRMVEAWKAAGIDPEGKKVGIVSCMAGIKVTGDRDGGFSKRIKELVPSIELMDIRYIDNDIQKALSTTEDLITANSDLIGLFADNNHAGVGTARGISEMNAIGKVIGVAFDADDEEVSALKSGALSGIVVQDPYKMGYQGVLYAVDSIEGKKVQKDVDTGANVITKDNMNDEDMVKLLDPSKN